MTDTYWCPPCNARHDSGYHDRNPGWAGREWLKPDADINSNSIKGPLPRFVAHGGDPIVGAAPQDLKKGQMVDLSGMIFYMAEDVVTGTLLTIGDGGTLVRARPIA